MSLLRGVGWFLSLFAVACILAILTVDTKQNINFFFLI